MLLEVSGLHKRYGDVTALNGLGFTVEEGEFFVLLGPSASGKTTTLRCITGIEKSDAGQIHFDGQDLAGVAVQQRAMAMVFQTFALYPHLSIAENLAYPLRQAGVNRSEIKKRVAEMAEMLRLTHTLKRKPETASGGEQQRIAIGRALIRRPRLLLLDEPITNLDAKLRHDTRAEFKRLHRDLGMTMVYATPDELEALSMGRRIAVMNDGQVVQTGDPDRLYDYPDSVFVAGMVGSPKINLMPAIHKGGGRIDLSFAELGGGPWSDALSGFDADTELVFGFRPHDVVLESEAESSKSEDMVSGPKFGARVHLTEPLGDITVLDLVSGDHKFRMVLPEEKAISYNTGDQLMITLDLDQSHLFAAETGTAIR